MFFLLCIQTRQEIVVESKNKYVYCRHCDLASYKSIHQFVNQFKKGKRNCNCVLTNILVYTQNFYNFKYCIY